MSARTVEISTYCDTCTDRMLWGFRCTCGAHCQPRGYRDMLTAKRLHACLHRLRYMHTVVEK